MSLRMNLYGCRISEFLDVLGTGNEAILTTASDELARSINDEDERQKAAAWAATLIREGRPLRSKRPAPEVDESGDLLITQMETETHVWAFHCLLRASCTQITDLQEESSNWKHGAIGALHSELADCGYLHSSGCPDLMGRWLAAFSSGTPLFGDDFQSQWSYYTVLSNEYTNGLCCSLAVSAG